MTLILVHSPKGGVGSTFIAAQLAMRLAGHGQQVTAVDFTQQDSLKLHFGLRPQQSLGEVGGVASAALVVLGVSLMDGETFSKLAPSGDGPASAGPFGDDPAIASLFPDDSVTIVDVASGDQGLKDRLMPFATLHVCALTPSPASIAVLSRIEPGTATVNLGKTAFVLNLLDDRLRLSRDTHKFLAELLGKNLIGSVRRDEAVNEALAMFQQIARFSPASVVLPDLDKLTSAIAERCGLAAMDLVSAGTAQ